MNITRSVDRTDETMGNKDNNYIHVSACTVGVRNTDSRHLLPKTAAITEHKCKETCSICAAQASCTNGNFKHG